ncbi:hypothetical protein QOZ80_6AG0528760 [Eleusine coracana subsp. coracana]|nr:hypothetical protein QOZ80_6AG0528760 [Eleusine coracana subsp. coracana]
MLRVAICRRGNHLYPRSNDYFMYKVGNKGPSLDLIASDPDDPKLADNETVLLRCRSRNIYFIARLSNRAPSLHEFDIHLYNSKTRTWTTKLMYSSKEFKFVYPSKVITFGGPLGSVGWVDLWRGILICDLLQDGRHLRYIPLPLPSVPKVLKGPPSRVRDIVVIQGKIKFFDMTTYMKLDPKTGYYVPNGWEAATCELDPSKKHQWKDTCAIKISEVTVSDPTHLKMLPNLKEGEEDTEAILKRLYARCPSLSLHHDGVVYIANKLEHQDDKRQWVIAADMNHKTLHDVAYYYSGRRLSYGHAFIKSEISKHLAISSATRYYFLYGS